MSNSRKCNWNRGLLLATVASLLFAASAHAQRRAFQAASPGRNGFGGQQFAQMGVGQRQQNGANQGQQGCNPQNRPSANQPQLQQVMQTGNLQAQNGLVQQLNAIRQQLSVGQQQVAVAQQQLNNVMQMNLNESKRRQLSVAQAQLNASQQKLGDYQQQADALVQQLKNDQQQDGRLTSAQLRSERRQLAVLVGKIQSGK
jgi:hypothetical protein